MKKRILLTGAYNNLIKDFLSHQTDTYEFKQSLPSQEALLSSLKILRPHAIIISLEDIIREDVQVYQLFKNSSCYENIPILTVGSKEDCQLFNEVIAPTTTTSLFQPYNIKDFSSFINKSTAYVDAPDYEDPIIEDDDEIASHPIQSVSSASTVSTLDNITSYSSSTYSTSVQAQTPPPYVEASRPTPVATKPISAPRTFYGKKRILVVDDDPRMLRSIKIQLEGLYDVTVVKNGRNALQVLSSYTVDLILLDYIMPEEDGTIVLQAIRQVPAFAHIPVIFLTGVSDGEKVKKGLELNPQGYLLKPVSRDVLLNKIESTLKKSLEY